MSGAISGASSQDLAYRIGKTITVDLGALRLNKAVVDATNAFEVVVSGGTGLSALFSGASVSCPGTGANSERFGSGAVATGIRGHAWGSGATATGNDTNFFGRIAGSTSTGDRACGFGTNIQVEADGVGSGYSLTVGARSIGFGSANGGGGTIGADSVGLGYQVNANGGGLGKVIVMGSAASDEGLSGVFVAGSATAPMNIVYFGKGVLSGTPTSYTLSGTAGSGAAVAGAALNISGGLSGDVATAGGALNLQVALAGTGTTRTTAWTVANTGFLNAGTDNTYDIGGAAGTPPRPRSGYFGTSVVTPAVTAPAALTLSSTGANNVAVNTNGSTRFMVDSGGGAHFYGTASTSGASEIITDFLTTGLSETTGARHLVKGTDAATNGGWRITTFRSDSTNERNPVWVRPAGGLEFTAYSTESCIFSTGGSERWRMTAAGGLEGRSSASQLTWTTGLGAFNHILGPSDQNLAIHAPASRAVTFAAGATERLAAMADGGIRYSNSSAAAVGAAGTAVLRVDGTGNLELSNNGGAFADIATTATSGVTLDGAYDFGGAGAGRTITVDSGAVRLNKTAADATNALEVLTTAGTGASISFPAGGIAHTHILGPSDQTLSIQAGPAATATSAGNEFSIFAGAGGATSGAGGILRLRAGGATAGNSNGGAASLISGAGFGAGQGGVTQVAGGAAGATGESGAVQINSQSGGATSGASGAVTIFTGTTTDGNTGAITLTTANATGTNRSGGAITATAGNATGTGTGGNFSCTAGSGGVSGTAGSVSITSGDGGTLSGTSGSVTIQSGNPNDGNSGDVTLRSAAANGTNRSGGLVSVTAGNATGNGTGGSVGITAGPGGASGTAGDVVVTGGDGGTSSGAAGKVRLSGGAPTDGNGGNIEITATAGVGTNRSGGNVVVTPGAPTGTGTRGAIQFNGRYQGQQGADVASANDLTLTVGNYFDITGAVQINAIATSGWRAGSMVTLQFDANPTVKHNTAGGAGFASLLLAGAVDFVASANDTLTLIYDGTTWREIARAVI